jgi:hypothetical protein
LRYFGGAVAFGFAAVWIMQSLAAALVCVLAAVAGYGAVFAAQRARAKLAVRADGDSTASSPLPPGRTTEAGDLSLRADQLNDDLGHLYDPAETTPSFDNSDPDESPAKRAN